MKLRPALLALTGLTIAIVSTMTISSKSQKEQLLELQNAGDRDTIASRVRQAKTKGERRAVLSAPIISYSGADSGLEELLSHYNAVIAEPVEQKSYILEERQQIVTWYKFRIVDNLSRKEIPACKSCSPSIRPPEVMLTSNRDEFLMAKYGGSVTVDGVEVSTVDQRFPDFSPYKKYLLFISLTDSRVAALGAGPEAIFEVAEGGTLEQINEAPHPVKRDIQNQYKKSLPELKLDLNQRPITN